MRAMVLNKPRTPLEWTELPQRHPGPGEIRVKVLACGVCRTDLHVVDGELPDPKSPIIPGHKIVGRIDEIRPGVTGLKMGEQSRHSLARTYRWCLSLYGLENRENLCHDPLFTGYTRDGGYATATIADARFAFSLGETGSDVLLPPLLFVGLIGWRLLGIAGEAKKLGLYGFGAAGHIVAKSRMAAARNIRLHTAWSPCQPSFRQEFWCDVGWRFR